MTEIAADPRAADAQGPITTAIGFLKASEGVLDKTNLELMIKGLLNPDPLLRMTALKAMESPMLSKAKSDLTTV